MKPTAHGQSRGERHGKKIAGVAAVRAIGSSSVGARSQR